MDAQRPRTLLREGEDRTEAYMVGVLPGGQVGRGLSQIDFELDRATILRFSALFLGRTIGIHEGDFSTPLIDVPPVRPSRLLGWPRC